MSLMPTSIYDPERAREQFPSLAFLVDDPEIGAVFRQFYEEGHDQMGATGAQWLQYKIAQTSWWRNNSQSARQYLSLQETQPGEWNRQLARSQAEVTSLANRLGVTIPPDRLAWIAERAVVEQLSEFEIRWMITQGQWATNSSSPIRGQVKQAFSNYLLPYNERLSDDATGNIINQQWTIDNLNEVLREQAKQLYPHLARQLDSGLNMQQILDPYRQTISRTLEISPDDIDFMDPQWRAVLDYTDAQGQSMNRLMTLTEAEIFARNQPRYKFTKQGRASASSLGETLAQAFGAVA